MGETNGGPDAQYARQPPASTVVREKVDVLIGALLDFIDAKCTDARTLACDVRFESFFTRRSSRESALAVSIRSGRFTSVCLFGKYASCYPELGSIMKPRR